LAFNIQQKFQIASSSVYMHEKMVKKALAFMYKFPFAVKSNYKKAVQYKYQY